MDPREQRIGANIVKLRSGRSQAEIAEVMRERGWKWSQATVSSVEKGERPLRLAEAYDLARILDGSPLALLQPPAESRVRVEMNAVSHRFHELAEAVFLLHLARAQLGRAVSACAEAGVELTPETSVTVNEWLSRTVEDAVAYGHRKWEHRQDNRKALGNDYG